MLDGSETAGTFPTALQATTKAFTLAGGKTEPGTPGGSKTISDAPTAARLHELDALERQCLDRIKRYEERQNRPTRFLGGISRDSDWEQEQAERSQSELAQIRKERRALIKDGKLSEAVPNGAAPDRIRQLERSERSLTALIAQLETSPGTAASLSEARMELARVRAEKRQLTGPGVVHIPVVEEVGKPGINWKQVTPEHRKKINPIVNHYAKMAHPFTACVRDNTKRFGPERAKRVCAVVKDMGRRTTKWRGKTKEEAVLLEVNAAESRLRQLEEVVGPGGVMVLAESALTGDAETDALIEGAWGDYCLCLLAGRIEEPVAEGFDESKVRRDLRGRFAHKLGGLEVGQHHREGDVIVSRQGEADYKVHSPAYRGLVPEHGAKTSGEAAQKAGQLGVEVEHRRRSLKREAAAAQGEKGAKLLDRLKREKPAEYRQLMRDFGTRGHRGKDGSSRVSIVMYRDAARLLRVQESPEVVPPSVPFDVAEASAGASLAGRGGPRRSGAPSSNRARRGDRDYGQPLPDPDFEKKHKRAGRGQQGGGRFIRKGSSGEDVQVARKQLGMNRGPADQAFEDAVKKLQASAGLMVDGIIGAQTAAALRGDKNAKNVKPGSLGRKDRRGLSSGRRRARRQPRPARRIGGGTVVEEPVEENVIDALGNVHDLVGKFAPKLGGKGGGVKAHAAVPEYDSGELTFKKFAGGSNGARWAKHKDGSRWLVKTYGGDEDRVATELFANAVYREMGARVPRAGRIRLHNGKQALAYRALEGKPVQDVFRTGGPSEAIGRHFMTDALLANWDVAGMDDDNVLWDASGEPFRVDQGGTLEFRAMGGSKDFGPLPVEVTSMLTGSGQGRRAAKVDVAGMRSQAKEIGERLTPGKIDDMLAGAGFKDGRMRARVRTNLLHRVHWMRQFGAGLVAAPAAPAPKPTLPPGLAEAFWLGALQEAAGIVNFIWDPSLHPRDNFGKFAAKINMLASSSKGGVIKGLQLDAKTKVQRDKDGSFRVVRSGGIIKGFEDPADAARAALDRSLKSKDPDSVAGGVSYNDYDALLAAQGADPIGVSSHAGTAPFGGKALTRPQLEGEVQRLKQAIAVAEESDDKYVIRQAGTLRKRLQNAEVKLKKLPPTAAPEPGPVVTTKVTLYAKDVNENTLIALPKNGQIALEGSSVTITKTEYTGAAGHKSWRYVVVAGTGADATYGDPGNAMVAAKKYHESQVASFVPAGGGLDPGYVTAEVLEKQEVGGPPLVLKNGTKVERTAQANWRVHGAAGSPQAKKSPLGNNYSSALMATAVAKKWDAEKAAFGGGSGIVEKITAEQLDVTRVGGLQVGGPKLQLPNGTRIEATAEFGGGWMIYPPEGTLAAKNFKNGVPVEEPNTVVTFAKTYEDPEQNPPQGAGKTHAELVKEATGGLSATNEFFVQKMGDLPEGSVIGTPDGKVGILKPSEPAFEGYVTAYDIQTGVKFEPPAGKKPVKYAPAGTPAAEAAAQALAKAQAPGAAKQSATGGVAPSAPFAEPPKPAQPDDSWGKLATGTVAEEKLVEAQKGALGKLASKERSSIYYYTNSGYETINPQLRAAGEIGDASTETTIAAMDSAFGHVEGTPEDMVVWRGISGSGKTAKYVDAQPGSVIRDNGFISTSVSESFAQDWGGKILLKIRLPKGSKGFYVGPGMDISSHGYERELILRRGIGFKVLANRPYKGHHSKRELIVEPLTGHM